ncbi:hypothetical protein KC949_02635 [Candidatus Saccharibacteria bacterium]|nr:hypothetical protein [Candidatus Saccharibacteria bacterium]
MADLDFDELDKQVNALMGKVNSGYTTTADEDVVKNLDIKPTLKDDESPKFQKVSVAAEKLGGMSLEAHDDDENVLTIVDDKEAGRADDEHPIAVKNNSTPTVEKPKSDDEVPSEKPERDEGIPERKSISTPRPSSGRFLDMVNPKSDMRNVAVPDRPSGALVTDRPGSNLITGDSTRGKLIQPIISDIKKPDTMQPKVSREGRVLQSANLGVASGSKDNTQPVTSPFLPDAKVDKRPLGGEGVGAKKDHHSDYKSKEFESDDIDSSSLFGVGDLNKSRNEVDMQRMLDASKFATGTPEEEHASELSIIEKVEVKAPEAPKPPKSLQEVESADTGVKEHVKAPVEITTDTAPGAEYDINKVDPKDREKILGAKKKPRGIPMTSILIVLATVVVISAGLGFLFLFRQ